MAELADEKGDVGAYGREVTSADRPAATAAADPQAVTGDAHQDQIADFLAALDSGRQPLVTGEEARASVAVIRAVYDSASSGRSVAPAKRH
jgi:predicted dehydrogenase